MTLKGWLYTPKQPNKPHQVLHMPSLPMYQPQPADAPNQSYFAPFLYHFRAIKKAYTVEAVGLCCYAVRLYYIRIKEIGSWIGTDFIFD